MISGTDFDHVLTLAATIVTSPPGSMATIDPWFSDASRAASSPLSAGTCGATADSSSVLASRSSAARPAGRWAPAASSFSVTG